MNQWIPFLIIAIALQMLMEFLVSMLLTVDIIALNESNLPYCQQKPSKWRGNVLLCACQHVDQEISVVLLYSGQAYCRLYMLSTC